MKTRHLFLLLPLIITLPGLQSCSEIQTKAFLQNLNESGGLSNTLKGLRDPSREEEIEIGRGVTETLLGARPLLDDPQLQRYVNSVGQWVAQHSERPDLEWHFGVNDSDHINAFAAPGGYIIVTKGMMRQLRNEAELAGVLGHEIAHVVQKHHLKALKKSSLMNLLTATVAAATAESRNAELVQKLSGPTRTLYARGLDKDDEFEADRMGVVLAARAGYDPYGLPSVLTTLAVATDRNPYLALLFKTHPTPDARIEQLGSGMSDRFDAFDRAQANLQRFEEVTRNL